MAIRCCYQVGGALVIFLREYKKQLPLTEETKESHQIIDDLIASFKSEPDDRAEEPSKRDDMFYSKTFDEYLFFDDLRSIRTYRTEPVARKKDEIKKSFFSKLFKKLCPE